MPQDRARAAARVLQVLERRWEEELPDGKLPRLMKAQLLKSDQFQGFVDTMQRTDTLPLPDLDFTPIVRRLPDGTMRNLLEDELGDDPKLYICEDCGDETARGAGRCDPCEHWRRTGALAK